MKPFKQLFFVLGALSFLVLIVGLASGCRKESNLRDKSPTGMVIGTDPGAKTAPKMVKLIFGIVPAAFQPNTAMVNLHETNSKAIAELRARDLLSPLPTPPYGIVGYTQFPDNNPDVQPGTFTNIYFVPHRAQQEMAHTVIHEWGHFLAWKIATPEERAAWELVYEELVKTHQLAKGYEDKGPMEQLAENFAQYTIGKAPKPAKDFFDKMKSARQ